MTKTKVAPPKKVARKKNLKKINAIVISAVVLVLLLIWGTVAITNASNDSDTSGNSSKSTEKVEKSLSGKSIDDDRKDALAAATDILNTAAKSTDGKTFEERVTALDEGDMTVVDPALESMIRFKDVFAESKDMQTNTYQSVVTLATLIQQSNQTETIAPSSDTMWKNVYVDSETGTAFVPLAIYAGPSAGFSFEMVYVDGNWELAPYSLLDAVRLSAKLQQTDTVPAPATGE